MPLKSVIPPIQEGTIDSVMHDMRDSNWQRDMLQRVKQHDLIISAYLEQIETKYGAACAISALLIYRIIESQIEADQMDANHDS